MFWQFLDHQLWWSHFHCHDLLEVRSFTIVKRLCRFSGGALSTLSLAYYYASMLIMHILWNTYIPTSLGCLLAPMVTGFMLIQLLFDWWSYHYFFSQLLGQKQSFIDVLQNRVFLKILQYSQENTCISLFLIKLQAFRPVTLLKKDSNWGVLLRILRNF